LSISDETRGDNCEITSNVVSPDIDRVHQPSLVNEKQVRDSHLDQNLSQSSDPALQGINLFLVLVEVLVDG
jgi:hypothetical protein